MARFFGKDKDGDDGSGAQAAPPASEQPTREEEPAREEPARQEQRAQATQEREQPSDAQVGSEPRPEDDPDYRRRLESSKREGSSDDEYQWHTGAQRPTGVPDAVEFVEVHKAFGRNKILRGLNMGIPE